MAISEGTGLGGTLSAFPDSGLVVANWRYQSISGYGESVAVIDDTHLGSTTFEESIPASLVDIDEITIVVYWEYFQSAPLFADGLTSSTTGTCTINLPTRNGVSGGTLTGTAFITATKAPDHSTAERSTGTITLKFDGKTGPTYAPHS